MGPIICDIAGLAINTEDKEVIEHPLVSGIILFSRNYESITQLKTLVKSLRGIKPELLIAVDQEGGRVQRFKKDFTLLPALGTIKTPEAADHFGFLMASELRDCGIDISFAPVVDCDKGISQIIGDRAFHHDPHQIILQARAYIQGMARAGMCATLKHFPGHGGVAPDSHLELPHDTRSWVDLEADMAPFVALATMPNVGAVMPAHIIYDTVDVNPVGFSALWLQTILREKIGFQGAIISDDLSMKAVHYLGDMSNRVQLALEAGCDNVLVCNDRARVLQVLDSIKDYRSEASKLRLAKMLAIYAYA